MRLSARIAGRVAVPALLLGCGLLLGCAVFLGCAAAGDEGNAPPAKSSAAERAERRLFDGAPPIIPHEPLGAPCLSCHNERGMAVAGLGFSPPSPHELTAGMGEAARCEQCHVFQRTDKPWVASTFEGLPQDLRSGARLFPGAPPVMPHAALMRENCIACHSGPAAREEIRTDHPERLHCGQCHVEPATNIGTAEPFPAV